MLLACVVGTASAAEPSGYGVNYLSASASVSLWGVVPSPPSVSTPVTLSWAWGGSVSSPRRLLLAWGATRLSGPTYKTSEMPGLNEFFNFIFQGLVLFGRVAGILVVPAPFAAVGIF